MPKSYLAKSPAPTPFLHTSFVAVCKPTPYKKTQVSTKISGLRASKFHQIPVNG